MIYLMDDQGRLVEEFNTGQDIKKAYPDVYQQKINESLEFPYTLSKSGNYYLYRYNLDNLGFVTAFVQDGDVVDYYDSIELLLSPTARRPAYIVENGNHRPTVDADFKLFPPYEKTYSEKLEEIRIERDVELQKLDGDWMRELGKKLNNQANNFDALETEKKTLRDFPATITEQNIDTIERPWG